MKAAICRPRQEEDIRYLLECSEAMLDNYVLSKLANAKERAKAIEVEQRAMARDLADADVARVVLMLRRGNRPGKARLKGEIER